MTVSIRLSPGQKAKDLILASLEDTIDQKEMDNLTHCISRASKVWLGLVDGELACAWGLVPATLLSDRAYLWLYSTPKINDHLFMFVRNSQRMMNQMLEENPLIHGLTDPANERTLRWLKWLGAKFGVPENGMVPFFIRKK